MIENDLVYKIKQVNYWAESREYTKEINRDNELTKANKSLVKSLLYYTSRYPNTLICNFELLRKAGMRTILSKDKKIKIYSWDDGQGGTQRGYEVVYQYKLNNGVKSKEYIRKYSQDLGGIYTHIYKAALGGKTYYLAKYYSTYMSTYYGESLIALKIESENLITENLIFKKNKELSNEIKFSYWLNKTLPHNEWITYNDTTKIISIPKSELKNEDIGTKKKDNYKYNGKYFVQIK